MVHDRFAYATGLRSGTKVCDLCMLLHFSNSSILILVFFSKGNINSNGCWNLVVFYNVGNDYNYNIKKLFLKEGWYTIDWIFLYQDYDFFVHCQFGSLSHCRTNGVSNFVCRRPSKPNQNQVRQCWKWLYTCLLPS